MARSESAERDTAGLIYVGHFCGNLSNWQTSIDTPVVLADDVVNQIVSVSYPDKLDSMGSFEVTVILPRPGLVFRVA